MRYLSLLSLLSLLFFATTLSAQAQHEERIPGELIVRLTPEASIDALSSPALAELGLVPIRNLVPILNIWLVGFDEDAHSRAGRSAADVLNVTRTASGIEVAQFNHVVQLRRTGDVAHTPPPSVRRAIDVANTPNDTHFDVMWGLHNTGQSGGTPGADISALDAWAINTGGITADDRQVVVAVIDSGFDLNHPDVNWWKNEAETSIPNGVDTDGNGYIDDYHGWNAHTNSGVITSTPHGTHVSGTVGARGNNGIGVVGIGWDMAVMPIQGSSGNEAVVVEAYGYALAMRQLYNSTNGAKGAFVVAANSSFGVNGGNPSNFPIWCGMFNDMGAVGIVSVGATSNVHVNVDIVGDIPTTCPSNYLISVTNTTRLDEKNAQAGYGTTHIDLGAPGTAIMSTIPNNEYSSSGFSGTSMAAPHVAGAVGYLVSAMSQSQLNAYLANPAAGATLVRQAILDGVDEIPALAPLVATGGRLNLYGALQQLGDLPDPPEASVNPNSLFFTLPADQTGSQFVTLSNLVAPGGQDLTYSVTVVPADEARPAEFEGRLQYATAGISREVVGVQSFIGRPAMQRSATSRDDHTWWLSYINEMQDTPGFFIAQGGSPGGYVHGTNNYVDTGKATAYTLPFDQTTGLIHGVDILMIRELPQTMSTYNVVIHSGTAATGPQGELYSQTFNVSGIPVDPGGYVWHEFTAPVAVGSSFFVSVEYTPPYALHDLGIAATSTSASQFEWERWDDMGWHLIQTAWGESWHMWTFVEVELPDYTPPAISVNPESGVVPADDFVLLEVTANSEGLDTGTYEYVVQITTNDPLNPTLTVDVSLTVGEPVLYNHPISADGGAGWRMLSSPLTGSTVQNLATANVVHGIPGEYPNTPTANLFTGYDGFNDPLTYRQGFVIPTGLSHSLVPGRGFIWYLYHDQYPNGFQPPAAGGGTSAHQQLPFDISFTGLSPVFETHQITFNAEERETPDDGFYLIGNPYGVPYNVRGIAPSSGSYSMTFQHWDAEAGQYVALNGFANHQADIAAGFFMQLGQPSTFPMTITFGPPGSGPPEPPPPGDAVEYFTARFELTGELLVEVVNDDGTHHIPVEVSDSNARVLFADDATDGFDFYDAGKLNPLSYYWANIAMMGMQGDEMVRRAVEGRPLPLEAVTIPMALSTYASGLDAGGTFTISLSENDLGAGWQAHLVDLETGEMMNLLTDSYTFTIEIQPAIDTDQRFEIIFTPPTVSDDSSGEIWAFGLEAVWPNPTTATAQVGFTLAETGEITIDVFDVLGRRVVQVASGEYSAGRHVLPMSTQSLASGVYVVRLTAGSQVAVQRVTVAR